MANRKESKLNQWKSKYHAQRAALMYDWLFGRGAFFSPIWFKKDGEYYVYSAERENDKSFTPIANPMRAGMFESREGEDLLRLKKKLENTGELNPIQTSELYHIFDSRVRRFKAKNPVVHH